MGGVGEKVVKKIKIFMVNPNELRVGNWVYCNGAGQVNFNVFDILFIKQYKNFDPITLTPEILGGCGFENDINDNLRFLKYPFEYNIYNKILIFKTSVIEHPIEFLHQLQNLYFDFYNKELEIKSLVNG